MCNLFFSRIHVQFYIELKCIHFGQYIYVCPFYRPPSRNCVFKSRKIKSERHDVYRVVNQLRALLVNFAIVKLNSRFSITTDRSTLEFHRHIKKGGEPDSLRSHARRPRPARSREINSNARNKR